MTSGRKRKDRRRARQVEAAQTATSQTPDAGTGARGASGLTATEETKLVARSIREGWGTQRWPTRTSISTLEAGAKSDATPIAKTMLTVVKLLDGDDRTKGIAARTLVAMEGQNQSDEHLQDAANRRQADKDKGAAPINVTVNLSVSAAIERVKHLPREERNKLIEAARVMRQLRAVTLESTDGSR